VIELDSLKVGVSEAVRDFEGVLEADLVTETDIEGEVDTHVILVMLG